MGRWFARFLLREGFEVVLSGRNQTRLEEAGRETGAETASAVTAVQSADVILLSVAIDSFEEVVRELADHIRPEQTVIDITSVKEAPVAAMHRYLKTEKVLGAHPLFGPGAGGIAHQNFVLTPTSETEKGLAAKVETYLTEREARVTIMSPQEHDAMMAVVLGLAHYIAIVSADTLLGLDKFKEMKNISGITYKVLLTLIESVLSEDPELYASLQMHLGSAAAIEKRFREKAGLWADLVSAKDRDGFVRRMTELKERLEKESPDFGKAYENMYRIAQDL